MKTSWEKVTGRRTSYVIVNYNNVVVGHHYGTGMTDAAGTCSHEAFLEGEFQGLIKEAFGEEVLAQVISAVTGSPADPAHNKDREDVAILRAFLDGIPPDPSLETLIRQPGRMDGREYMKKINDETIVESRTTVLANRGRECRMKKKESGETLLVLDDFYLSGCVARNGRYYAISGDNFYVITPEKGIIFTTHPPAFLYGYKLRFSNVAMNGEAILVYFWWVTADYPPGWLRHEDDKGFTGRIEKT